MFYSFETDASKRLLTLKVKRNACFSLHKCFYDKERNAVPKTWELCLCFFTKCLVRLWKSFEAKILFQPCQVCKQWARKRKSHFVNSHKDIWSIYFPSTPLHSIHFTRKSVSSGSKYIICRAIPTERIRKRKSALLRNAMVIKLRKCVWERANTHAHMRSYLHFQQVYCVGRQKTLVAHGSKKARATLRYYRKATLAHCGAASSRNNKFPIWIFIARRERAECARSLARYNRASFDLESRCSCYFIPKAAAPLQRWNRRITMYPWLTRSLAGWVGARLSLEGCVEFGNSTGGARPSHVWSRRKWCALCSLVVRRFSTGSAEIWLLLGGRCAPCAALHVNSRQSCWCLMGFLVFVLRPAKLIWLVIQCSGATNMRNSLTGKSNHSTLDGVLQFKPLALHYSIAKMQRGE